MWHLRLAASRLWLCVCRQRLLWHGLPARGLAVRRELLMWHGFVTRGLAVFRQHRSYSTDLSKSAALFTQQQKESLKRLLVSIEYHRSVPGTAPMGWKPVPRWISALHG